MSVTPDGWIDDGHGAMWPLCDRVGCGLHVVRPGHTECHCDNDDGAPWETPARWRKK